ncbi:MAG: hypothetical protein V4719_24210 [Planctomycetota bacterium]
MPEPRGILFTKRITLAATAGNGAQGTVNVFTVTGAILIQALNVRCISSVTGASAALTLGTAGVANGLIASTTGTGITAGLSWSSATPGTLQAAIVNRICDDNIIITVGTADVTGGVLEFEILYKRMSADGLVS